MWCYTTSTTLNIKDKQNITKSLNVLIAKARAVDTVCHRFSGRNATRFFNTTVLLNAILFFALKQSIKYRKQKITKKTKEQHKHKSRRTR